MKFFYKIKFFKEIISKKKDIENIMFSLPNSQTMAKDILNMLGNRRTRYTFDKDIKNSYYIYFTDTIYLSDKQNDNRRFERLCVIAHECIHSIQPKLLQNLNFIFSNLEIVSFIVIVILKLLSVNLKEIFWLYLVINILGIIFRLILEVWATLKAPNISVKYLNKINVEAKDVNKVDNLYSFFTRLLMPLFVVKLVFLKIIRIVISYFISFKWFL